MSAIARQAEPITRQGYERLRAELEQLVTVRRRELTGELRDAREDGVELGDNAAVAAVLEDHLALERRIDELEAALSFVSVVGPPDDGTVGIGHRVRIRLGARPEPVEYQLVGPRESDPQRRRISIDSPVGRALVGARAGETVEVETPSGALTVELLAVAKAP